ncbi:hypothetical protein, conserved [Eimeria maxima]|uniref:Uncharacterized protein n=1 Tax=Eimeria maxima TaxID=5804 RepID=U6MEH9_EIMMA|nr:hypothetical protein, conserved [Eimeria maxima]CDJ60050.1 hypothetical protein, conserved [Eimeria maxima]
MVLLHVKTADEQHQFLFNTKTSEIVKDVISEVTALHLKRMKALKVADAAEALATYGPLRPEETRGLTEEVAKLSNLNVYPDGPPTNPDPHFYRTGLPPPKEVADIILRTCAEAKEALSHKKVERREALRLEAVQETLNVLQGALQIAYPANHGLPSWEPVRLILEDKETTGSQEISENITLENACLWWTGKQLQQTEALSKYLGTNEKTKTVVRLQPKNAASIPREILAHFRLLFFSGIDGSVPAMACAAVASTDVGPPIREPRMDAETHKAVLAYCHKKRQEDKVRQYPQNMPFYPLAFPELILVIIWASP